MTPQRIIKFTLLLFVCWSSYGSLAQQPAAIGDLSTLDLQYMTQQREVIQDLATINLGRQFAGDRDPDLALLQALLDKQLVRPDQVPELQAMGIIIGDLLAAELGMHWVVYEDNIGRSRALRYRETDDVLFPMTMISRRREAGNQTSVTAIYQKASGIITERSANSPLQ